MAGISTENDELKRDIEAFDLVGYISRDLGEAPKQSGDMYLFHNCPCGHHGCLRVTKQSGKPDLWRCYSDSSKPSDKDHQQGDIIDYLVFSKGLDKPDATRFYLDNLASYDVKGSQRRFAAEHDINAEPLNSWTNDNPCLERFSNGNPKKAQILAAYTFDLEHDNYFKDIYLDGFTQEIIFNGQPLDESDMLQLLERFNQRNLYGDKKLFVDALATVARRRKKDALSTLIESLPKSVNRDHAELIFIKYLGAEDTPYTRAVTELFLKGGIARALNPGVKFDYMPVLIGPQGIGKSVLCCKLAMNEDYFTDSVIGIGTKEAAECLRSIWIAEISELEGFKRAGTIQESIKGFITRTADKYRPPYGARTQSYPRRCVFIGTTNDYSFLTDRTGNRRFLPIVCKGSKTDSVFDEGVEAYIRYAWADALQRYENDSHLILPSEIEEQARDIQSQMLEDDPDVGIIQEWLECHEERICAKQIAVECLHIPDNSVSRKIIKHIHTIMENEVAEQWQKLPKKQKIKGYGTQWCYERIIE